MAYLFRIEPTVARLNLQPGDRRTIEFDVSNVTPTAPRGRFEIDPTSPRMCSWFRALGSSDVVTFKGRETKRLRFELTLPVDVGPGKYSFKLRGAQADAPPDEDESESSSAEIDVEQPVVQVPDKPVSHRVSTLETWLLGILLAQLTYTSLLVGLKWSIFATYSWMMWTAAVLFAFAGIVLRKLVKAVRPGCSVEQLWGHHHVVLRLLSAIVFVVSFFFFFLFATQTLFR